MKHAFAVFLCFLFFSGSPHAETVSTQHYELNLVTLAGGLDHPWGMAFLPGGDIIVTEREGQIRIVSQTGTVSKPLNGVPQSHASGQGGMLDIVLDPDFAGSNRVYISYSEPGSGGAGTAVARAQLDRQGHRLTDVQVIFRMYPKSGGSRHFGSRLVFARDGKLFITLGDRGERERAQDTSVNRGQVVRINPDGSVPGDNPFVAKPGHRPEIWSYGHRNPQGAALHPATGDLWTVEHGARGGDEINIPLAGRNYGWPVIAYGRHYFGGKIGEGTRKEGMEQPIHYWDPSIAPSGMAFYSGGIYPAWKGNVFVGALSFRLLSRLELDGNKVIGEERLLESLGERIRDVRQGPRGYLHVLTDSPDGRVIRLEPSTN